MLYVQDVLDISPGRAAWYFPALNLAVIAGSLLGPRLIGRFGARWSAVAGFGLIAASTVILTSVPSHGLPSVRLLTSFAVMGVGLAIASVASTTVGTTAAAPSERGLVSGLLNSAAQIGTALGLAVIIPLAARPGSDPEVMLSGLRWGFIGAGLIAGAWSGRRLLLPVRDRGEPAAREKAPPPDLSAWMVAMTTTHADRSQRADISGAMPTARAGASASPQAASQLASIW